MESMLRLGYRRERYFWLILLGVSLFYIAHLVSNGCGVSLTQLAINAPTALQANIPLPMLKPHTTTVTPKAGEAMVYRWKNRQWSQVPGFCSKDHKFNAANLRTPFGNVKMYIHDVKKDVHVSGSLKRSGMWDSGGVSSMISSLKKDPTMGFLDLGSQLGTYSLVAAKMGRHVVSVDPLVENVLRLCRTIQEGNLTDRVTILFTALSDGYRTVSFKRYPGNIGGTHIEAANNAKPDVNDNYNANFINTVRLDDILPFVNFPKAFIKIDVENHEYEALKEGRQLFSSKDIRGILMEWFQIKLTPNGKKLKRFLTNLTFVARDPIRGNLLISNFRRWPNDILWMKK